VLSMQSHSAGSAVLHAIAEIDIVVIPTKSVARVFRKRSL